MVNESCVSPAGRTTPAAVRANVRAVTRAQQLADAERRVYLVARTEDARRHPFVTQLAGLEGLAGIIEGSIAAGVVLVVPPQGMHAGLSGVEILAAEIAARERVMIDERLMLDAAFRARHLGQ